MRTLRTPRLVAALIALLLLGELAPARAEQSDLKGGFRVNVEGQRPTYRVAFALTNVAGATDVACVQGSSTKTIRVTQIAFAWSGAGIIIATVIKRSAVNTGGTSTTPTLASLDSLDAAPTAVVTAYTANPTGLGAAVGTVSGAIVPGSANGVAFSQLVNVYGGRVGKPITLRGASQWLCVNLNGTGVAASGQYEFELTEE